MGKIHFSAIRDYLLHDWMNLIPPLAVLAMTLAGGLIVRAIIFGAARRWVKRTGSHAAEAITHNFYAPFMTWVLLLGLHLGLEASELPQRVVDKIALALLVLWILSITFTATRVAGNVIKFYGNGIPGALPVTTLTENLAAIGIWILGIVVIVTGVLGKPITPILTALGVGGLAVALALQDTLSNLFAGFYVAVAGQIRLGDYIKLNSGEEGYVTDITWRSTTIRGLGNNLIIIPNNKLAQAIVTNFHLPEKKMSVSFQVGIEYGAEVERVQSILLEEVMAAQPMLLGMLREPAPNVKFDPGFGDSALIFSVNCHVAEFIEQFEVRQQLRQRIYKRLMAEKIGFAYPTRTVYVKGQSA